MVILLEFLLVILSYPVHYTLFFLQPIIEQKFSQERYNVRFSICHNIRMTKITELRVNSLKLFPLIKTCYVDYLRV